MIAEDVEQLGFRNLDIRSLKLKHVAVLVVRLPAWASDPQSATVWWDGRTPNTCRRLGGAFLCPERSEVPLPELLQNGLGHDAARPKPSRKADYR